MKPAWSLFFSLVVPLYIYHPVCQIEISPQAQQRMVQEKISPDPTPGMGTQETPRSDGGKDTVYYSIVTPEEEKKKQEEEKEKQDKSWDTLRNIIIDNRRTR